MSKHISDEQLLTALLVHGGVAKAATALNMSRNAIYKRLKDDSFRQQDDAFRAQYDSTQGALLSVASTAMADGLNDAVNALLDVIRDKDSAASVRVSAADSLLRHCCRYIESASICRRLDALEAKNINMEDM